MKRTRFCLSIFLSVRPVSLFVLLSAFCISTHKTQAQLPGGNLLVGYHENWNSLKLSQAHANYNVLCLAFALPAAGTTYDMRYQLPYGYASVAAMQTDIDLVHSQGKKVVLSVGGATAVIKINSVAERTTFENSINTIFSTYGNKIDGLDIDLEGASMAFGTTWTMSVPNASQTHFVNAIKNIMATYQTVNGKKMLLTMAPEAYYLMGALSPFQINSNGGSFLPILDGLRNELDLLHMQLYNAGGAGGGMYAWNGTIYYDNGTMDFALAMNESIIKGFTLLNSKGTFTGIPASKITFGFPATTAPTAAGTGYVTPANICNGVRYFKGQIAKPAGVTYTMSAFYPTMRGLMTWSINEDFMGIPQWNFASNFTCAFPLPVVFAGLKIEQEATGVGIHWITAEEQNMFVYSIERSLDGKTFIEVGKHTVSSSASQISQSYYFQDLLAQKGLSLYYRIKAIDIDGSLTYSDVAVLNHDSGDLVVFPNPFTNNFTLTQTNIINVQIYTMEGLLMEEGKVTERDSDFWGSTLRPGAYILKVNLSEGIECIKLIKE